MAGIHKLTTLQVANAKPGYLGDGGGLYLQTSTTGARSWVFRYRSPADRRPAKFKEKGPDGSVVEVVREVGNLREMGLGSLQTISLADARKAALVCRKQLLDAQDPIQGRRSARAATRLAVAKLKTFREVAEAFLADTSSNAGQWRNAKHSAQWSATLTTYAYPILGKLPVDGLTPALIKEVLHPIWTTKHETASRVRGRIKVILDYAKAQGWRSGENPAEWEGNLDHMLAAPTKVAKVEHHASLPWAELPAFLAQLEHQGGISALALRYTILTAARTGEVIGSTWNEIDLDKAVWRIDGSRMKAGKEHRVPLSEPAIEILRKLKESATGDYVFPGQNKTGKPLSNMAMLTLLERMKRTDLTVHGFRGTFSSWCADKGKPVDIREAALAHSTGSKTIDAYQSSDLLERRRLLMQEWATFCTTHLD